MNLIIILLYKTTIVLFHLFPTYTSTFTIGNKFVQPFRISSRSSTAHSRPLSNRKQTLLPDNDSGDSSGKPKRKRNLLIFGHGNVAKAVIQQHQLIIPQLLLNNTRSTKNNRPPTAFCWNDYRFDSITCTFNKTPPTDEELDLNNVHYVPFDIDKIVDEILLSSSSNKYVENQPITHVLVTIPPQPKQCTDKNNYDRGPYSTSNYTTMTATDDDAATTNTTTSTIIYEDVILKSSKFQKYIQSSASSNIESIAFVSTTGVYGNHNGEWVDESLPSNIKCKVGSKAYGYWTIENQWKECILSNKKQFSSSSKQTNFMVFRCSGLYGNQFSALHTLIKSSEKNNDVSAIFGDSHPKEEDKRTIDDSDVSKPSNNSINSFITSRVHLDDVGRSIIACFAHHDDHDKYNVQQSSISIDHSDHCHDDVLNDEEDVIIYNLSDDMPCPRTQVMNYAYNLLLEKANIDVLDDKTNNNGSNHGDVQDRNLEFNTTKLRGSTERRRRRSQDQKRVSNKKLRRILEASLFEKLKYPTFHEGLVAILNHNLERWRDEEQR